MFLFGSGGHSSEMLLLIKNAQIKSKVDSGLINKVICVISEDDRLIKCKIDNVFDDEIERHVDIVTLRRARKVGQSYLTSIYTTLISILHSINLVSQHKPNLCLTNGPALGLTITLAIRIMQLLTLGTRYTCDIIYIESFCRTKTLSLTGKLIYHLRLADKFFVQWPKLSDLYPRSIFKGLLV